MLSSKTGKLLSKKFEETQAEVFADKDNFTSVEQSFYDLPSSGTYGNWEDVQEAFTIDAESVDTGLIYGKPTKLKDAVDLRKRPECGD